jgi:hypothetical protein
MLLSFLWGLPAVTISAFLATRLSPGRAARTVPLLEELLKALVLLYLVRRPSFTYFVDGAVYGFAVGIGFAVFENLLYIYQHPATGLTTAAGRVFSTNLMHAGTSAIVGIALGLARFRRFSRRALFLGAGLSLAVLFHAGFNRLVTAGGGPLLPLYAVLAGLGALAFVALAIRRGLDVQRRWIGEKLGTADRVTAAESDAVAHLASGDAPLQPLVTLFGAEKAAAAQRVLLLQARLGILRKTLERAGDDPPLQQALSTELQRTGTEMENARRQLGPYLMISLRTLFPAGDTVFWTHLERILQDRRAGAGATPSTNLFALLEERLATRNDRRQ